MNVIILAGGMGKRLRSVVSDVPKPMAPINGKPFLEYIVKQLAYWGHRNIVLSVGYRKDVIIDHFQDGNKWGVSIRYSEEDRPLGTGGAAKKALTLVPDAECIVMNGDSFIGLNFNEFLRFHDVTNSTATVALTSVQDIGRFGSVEVEKAGKVVSFREKGQVGTGLINCGIYVLHRSHLEVYPLVGFSLENDVLTNLSSDGTLNGFVQEGDFIDIGIPEDFRNAQKLIPRQIELLSTQPPPKYPNCQRILAS
jgi:D-glycero-alpha-D-manno-heptose 1-phosphate guanylyltransferase